MKCVSRFSSFSCGLFWTVFGLFIYRPPCFSAFNTLRILVLNPHPSITKVDAQASLHTPYEKCDYLSKRSWNNKVFCRKENVCFEIFNSNRRKGLVCIFQCSYRCVSVDERWLIFAAGNIRHEHTACIHMARSLRKPSQDEECNNVRVNNYYVFEIRNESLPYLEVMLMFGPQNSGAKLWKLKYAWSILNFPAGKKGGQNRKEAGKYFDVQIENVPYSKCKGNRLTNLSLLEKNSPFLALASNGHFARLNLPLSRWALDSWSPNIIALNFWHHFRHVSLSLFQTITTSLSVISVRKSRRRPSVKRFRRSGKLRK